MRCWKSRANSIFFHKLSQILPLHLHFVQSSILIIWKLQRERDICLFGLEKEKKKKVWKELGLFVSKEESKSKMLRFPSTVFNLIQPRPKPLLMVIACRPLGHTFFLYTPLSLVLLLTFSLLPTRDTWSSPPTLNPTKSQSSLWFFSPFFLKTILLNLNFFLFFLFPWTTFEIPQLVLFFLFPHFFFWLLLCQLSTKMCLIS